MKKTVSFLIAALMAISMAVPAFAQENDVGSQFIVNNIVYKVSSSTPAAVEVEGPVDKSTITQANIPGTVVSPENGSTYTVKSFLPQGNTPFTGAFSDCPNLVSASVPATVKNTGYSTFYGCSNLTSLTFAEGVEQIGDFTAGYTHLTSITIPSTVTSIGECAFVNCSNLATIRLLPTTAPTFGPTCFDGAASGATAYVPGNSIGSGTGKYNLNEYPFYDGDPLNLKAIIYSEFNWYGIVYGVTSPTTIIAERPVDKTTLTDANLYEASGTYELTAIEPGAFRNCTALTTVAIPGTVKNIGAFTFYGCDNLTSMSLGEGVETIGTSAVSYTNLSSIKIPSTVTAIGSEAFRYNPALSAVTFAGTIAPSFGYKCFDDIAPSAVAYVPEGRIGTDEGMYFSNSYPFANSMPLKAQEQFTVNNIVYKVNPTAQATATVLGPAQIAGFTQANIPSTVTSPVSGIAYTVTAIAPSAFKGCYSLTSVSIPGTITDLSNYVFQNCGQLNSLTLGEGIQRIGKNILTNCGNLQTITVPRTVTVIDDSFNNCSNLGQFTFLPTTAPEFIGSCFANTAPAGIGRVPAGRLGTGTGMYNQSVYPLANLSLIEMS